MPFTPFHFGPPAIIKAVMPTRFSYVVFCVTQVVTDVEVAYHMVRRDGFLHGFAHTYAGATVVGLASGVVAAKLWPLAVRLFPSRYRFESVLPPPSLTVSVFSALLGSWSHVLFDSLMHHDMEPWWPLSGANPMIDLVPVSMIHEACVLTGTIGAIALIYGRQKSLK